MEYLFCYMPPTPNKIWEDNLYLTKHSKFRSQHKFFFVRTEIQHIQVQILVNHFKLILLIFFSEIMKKSIEFEFS